MREPRPRQRLVEGGLDIYEGRKAGTWNHANLIFAYPDGYVSPSWGKKPKDEILSWGYTVLYQRHFDPMLYFWPCDACQIILFVDDLDTDHTQRLVRACLRDGADLVVSSVRTVLTSTSRIYTQEKGWKKPDCEWDYEVPPPSKKSRYEMTLALIREEERKKK